jgi:hypothetical protein
MAFTCHYELDQRPDVDLVRLFQEAYRLIESALGDTYRLPIETDGLPDAVQYYLLYAAALIYGAADASLTLTLHNLGREARIVGRQIFEYWTRAQYYASNPAEAKRLLLSSPFREREILDELGYDKETDRYRDLEKDCDEVLARYPGADTYREPRLRNIVGSKHDPIATKYYAFLYRIPSQTVHGAGAGLGVVMGERGVAFDSRETKPNISLSIETWLLLQFLSLINNRMRIDISSKLEELKERLTCIESRLGEDRGGA